MPISKATTAIARNMSHAFLILRKYTRNYAKILNVQNEVAVWVRKKWSGEVVKCKISEIKIGCFDEVA
jgi:hypothetical protein